MYSVMNHDLDLVELNEFIVQKSKVVLNHDLTGLFPYNEEFNMTQYRKGITKSYKPPKSDYINGSKDDMVLYFNYILDNQGSVYTRRHFAIIDLAGQ